MHKVGKHAHQEGKAVFFSARSWSKTVWRREPEWARDAAKGCKRQSEIHVSPQRTGHISNKCIATRNKSLTSSNKKLLVTSASLLSVHPYGHCHATLSLA